jgi:alpha-L-rhamnosidase
MTIDWTARFVAAANHVAAGPADYVRRDFTVGPGLERATLEVTALGLIEPYVNGQRIGNEVLMPGWTAYEHRIVVSSFDVTALLAEGPNAMGAVLGEGWAVGRLTWAPDTRQLWADRPAAFVQLTLEYPDRTEHIGTDSEWVTGTGGVRENGLYDGETYDARLEPEAWSRAGFDATAWQPVDIVDVDLARLTSTVAPPIRRIQEVPAVSTFVTPAGRRLVDFGQVMTGWVRLRVDAPAGTTIGLRHCEAVIGGEPAYETNRSAQATDTYISDGSGETVWEPRFTFHGFRYVEVVGWPGELDLAAFTGIVVHSDMVRTGWFECSNPDLNRLHDNVVWSMRGNFVGVPTDCPQRDERLGWTGDINAFAPTAAFLYDVRGVLGSWLTDLALEQRDAGGVPLVVPDALRQGPPVTALWGDVAVSLPWGLYREYGDRELLARQYESMTAFVDQVAGLLDEHDLWSRGFQFGDWLDPDAPPDNPAGAKTDAHLVAGAYFCKVTRELANTAQILEFSGDAERYRALHERVLAGFRREWVTPSGRLANETATAYALAICFDVLAPDQQARGGARLAQLVAGAGYRIATGFAGTPLVVHALSRTGQVEAAYRLLTERSCPSFLYPLSMGATTIWERWDAIRPDGTLNDTGMTSLNHYALGAVADWMHRVIGGLTALEPGYRTMRIAPLPGGDLTSASVTHDTAHGRVRVAWHRDAGRFSLDAVIPEGTSAEVVLPQHPDDAVHTIGPGEHRWEYELAATEVVRDWSLDSVIADLAGDPVVWPRIAAVFAQHFPGQTGDGSGEGMNGGFRTARLRDVISFAAAAAPNLEADLVAALAS